MKKLRLRDIIGWGTLSAVILLSYQNCTPGFKAVSGLESLSDYQPDVNLSVKCNIEELSRSTTRRLTQAEYDNTVRFIFGDLDYNPELLPDDVRSTLGFKNNGNSQTVLKGDIEKYYSVAETIVNKVSAKNEALFNCSVNDKNACIEGKVKDLAKKLFRRPPEVDEISSIISLAQSQSDVRSGVELALTSLLISPSFLFIRVAEDQPAAINQLSQFEVAERMSYFLWNSAPDDELYSLAESGQLFSGNVLRQQAERMLKDARAEAFVKSFVSQWLDTEPLGTVEKSLELYPNYQALAPQMRRETELFFLYLIQKNRPIEELLLADYSIISKDMAEFYNMNYNSGTPMSEEPGYKLIPYSGVERKGLLTHASVLATSSGPTEPNPTLRGLWVMQKFLCDEPPPPPDDVAAETGAIDPNGSIKERFAQHRQSGSSCIACHTVMDPIGFGLHNFGSLGEFRTIDREGFPVEPDGTLLGKNFTDSNEMIDLIAKGKQFKSCFASKLASYALGRDVEPSHKEKEGCFSKELAYQTQEQAGGVSDLIVNLITSDLFTKQKTGN